MAACGDDDTSDDVVNIKCSVCAEKERTREAEKYCVECKDYYCISCVDVHTMIPALRGHTLLDKNNFRNLGPDESLPSFPTQRCSLHQAEVVNMYCKDHDAVGCASCVASFHRTCTNVQSIPDELEHLYDTAELDDIKLKIRMSKESVEGIKKEKESRIEELKKSFDKAVDSVNEFKQSIEVILDKLAKETIKELKDEHDRKQEIMTKEITEAEDLINSLDEMARNLKKSKGNRAQEFVSGNSCRKLTAKADDLQEFQQHLQTDSLNIQFAADTNITEFLNHTKVLGKAFGRTSSTETCIPVPKVDKYKVKKKGEINVKIVKDTKDCRFYGTCVTTDGFLLLADINNKRLKRVDLQTETVKDYIDFVASPVAVCQVSSRKAAVALMNQSVQFVSLDTKLTALHTLTMDHICYGLAYTNGRLFISDQGKTVFIHNIKGEKLKEVTGNDLFNASRHIAVDVSGGRIFVADSIKGLVIMDTDGNHHSTFSKSVISQAQGVCTDGRNLFICGYISNNIVQIGQNDQFVGVLEKVPLPLSISFDPNKTRLIVTQLDSNSITVMELEAII